MDIPDQYVGWIVAGQGAVMAWLLNMQRQMLARPTRKELRMENAKEEAAINKRFDKLEQLIEKQNEQTALHRELMGGAIAEIRTRVAVLRERSGDDPLGDTGAHRRRL